MEIRINSLRDFKGLPLGHKMALAGIALLVPVVVLLALALAVVGIMAVPVALAFAVASPVIAVAAWILKGALKLAFAFLPLILLAAYLIFWR